jgi:peptide/nickel transport system substrate-binding protein
MFLLSRNHLSDVADPIGFLTADYTCEGGYNLSQYCDPEVDSTLQEAQTLTDSAARYAAYASVAKKLQDEAVTTFLVHVQQSDATSTGVSNYRIHPYAHYVLVPDLTLNPQ